MLNQKDLPGISEETKRKILDEYLKNPEGRKKLAASMVQPLRGPRDYPPKHRCDKCMMGWNDDAHVHDEEECVLYRIHES